MNMMSMEMELKELQRCLTLFQREQESKEMIIAQRKKLRNNQQFEKEQKSA